MTNQNKISIRRLTGFSLLGVTMLMAVTIPYALTARAGEVDCPPAIDSFVDSDVFVDGDCTVKPIGEVDGNIKVEGDKAVLQMYGDLDGDILAKDCIKVVVNQGARMNGNVKVENCDASPNPFDVKIGTVGDKVTIEGNVEVKDSGLQIGAFAKITGNVKVENGPCEIHDDATIEGNREGTC